MVAQLKGVLGTALQDWVRSLDIRDIRELLLDKDGVLVDPDSTLVFNFQSRKGDIELTGLRRILSNISNHSNDVYEYLVSLHGTGEKPIPQVPEGRDYALAARKLVTMRDSSWEMVRLLKGEDLDEDDTSVTVEIGGLSADEFDVLHDIAEDLGSDPFAPMEDPLLKLAQVHRQLRALTREIPNTEATLDGAVINDRLEKTANYIRS